MAGENFNPFGQGSWPEEKSNQSLKIGTGEGESPMTTPGAPKMPDLNVRTYGSDVKSMAESGGGPPKPYQPVAPAPAAPQPEEKKSFSEVFETPGGVSPLPAEVPPAGLQEFGAAPKSRKGLFAVILGIIIVVGLGAIGYFYVYPTFFGGAAKVETPPPVTGEPQTPAPPLPVLQVPAVPPVPVVETTSTATTTGGEIALPQALLEHKSLLTSAADVSTEVTLGTISVAAMRSEMEFSTAQVPILKEIVFKNADGEILTSAQILGEVLADVFTSALAPNFEADFTLLTYANDKGTWPVYVLKAGADATLAEVKTAVSKLESSANRGNLFVTDPGTASAWKSGTTEGVANRYSTYSLAGASLNYGWTGNILVISASYPGFQEVLKRLK